MKVSILGCGWFGKALALSLMGDGVGVKGSATSPEKIAELTALGIEPALIRFPDTKDNDTDFFTCDVLVVSIPPKFRKGESDAFIPKVKRIIEAIVQHKVPHVIYTSSTAVYGDSQGTVTELDEPQPEDESGKLLLEAEQLFQSQTKFKTTIIRFGGLVGPGRNPARFFAGKKDVPNGLSPVNLLHLADAVGISMAVITKAAWGKVFNACSPQHPSRVNFYTSVTQKAGLELPEFKNELQTKKIVNSLYLKKLLGYQFKYEKWKADIFN